MSHEKQKPLKEMPLKNYPASTTEQIDKFSVLFPNPETTQRYKSIVGILVKNKIGLKKGKTQSIEQFELECLLRVQYCEAIGLPFVLIGETYMEHGNVKMQVDGMMWKIDNELPDSEFILLESTPKKARMKVRRGPEFPWIPILWTIEKAEKLIGAFDKKVQYQANAAGMLITRCYGTGAKAVGLKELRGVGRGFRSREEINELGLNEE